MGLVLEFEMWKHFDTKQILFCAIVCDCMVYPDHKFLMCKTKKRPRWCNGKAMILAGKNSEYGISANSFHGKYSFLNL